jgi:hypothetical protein
MTISVKNKYVVCFCILLGVLLCLFIRRPDAFINPQFWAEDGTVFFMQSFYSSPLFFIPYQGYLHLIPRIVAYLSTFFGLCATPKIYNYFSIIATVFVAYKLMSCRLKIPYKYLIALSIVLVPHSGEVFSNLTNLQWIVSILLIILIIQAPPNAIWQIISDFAILILIGLTGPFIVIFFPLMICKLWLNERISSYDILFFLVSLVLVCIQINIIINGGIGEIGGTCTKIDLWVNMISNRFANTLFFGTKLVEPNIGLFLLSLGLIAFILFSAKQSEYKKYIIIFFIAAALILFSTLYKFRAVPDILIQFNNGDRYFYLIRLYIIWSLIVLLEHKNRYIKTASVTILVVMLISSFMWFQNQRLIDYNWQYYCKKIIRMEEKQILIPINPKGWFIKLETR